MLNRRTLTSPGQLHVKWVGFILLSLSSILASCGSGDLEITPPADLATPTTTMYLNFGVHQFYDTVTGRHDPCKFFDGQQNKATTIVVRIQTPNSSVTSFVDLYPPQVFRRYPDFPGGDPNGLGFNVPAKGGYSMLVTIYGEADADCCPGSPPGKPVFEQRWPYDVTKEPRLRHMMPEFIYCIW